MSASVPRSRGLGVLVVGAVVMAGSLVAVPAAGGTGARAAGAPLTAAQIRHLLQPAPGVQIAPTVARARQIHASLRPNATGNLTYQGGPVMQAANNSVPIFWMPSKVQDGTPAAPSAKYLSLIERYFDDIGGSPLYQIATQYYQSIYYKVPPKQYIVNASHRLLAVVDTSAYPAAGTGCAGTGPDCLDDGQVRDEVLKVSEAHSLPQDLNTEYFVFLAPHESTCHSEANCFYSDTAASSPSSLFCAYHAYFYQGVNAFIYANLPYDAVMTTSKQCTMLSSFPNDRDADIEINLVSHEQLESTTDPTAGAWFYLNGAGEIADECQYNTGTLGLDGGLANEQWHGHYYVVQQEWSNAISGCSQGVAGAPAAPTAVKAVSRSTTTPTGSLTVTFTIGANNGSAITGQTATCKSSNGGATKTGTHTGAAAAPITVAAVTTAKTYTCTVTATNAHGAGSASAPSGGVIVGSPAAPTGVRAVSRSTTTTTGSLTVTFTIGPNNGSAITGQTATCTSSNGGATKTGTHTGAAAAPITVAAVTTAKTYTCTVKATNARGASIASDPSSAVIMGAPAAPAKPTVTKTASGTLKVAFGAPANNGTRITSYTATCTSTNAGVTKSHAGTSSPITVSALTAAKTYTCAVTATNGRGTGPRSSPSAAITA